MRVGLNLVIVGHPRVVGSALDEIEATILSLDQELRPGCEARFDNGCAKNVTCALGYRIPNREGKCEVWRLLDVVPKRRFPAVPA